MVGGKVRDLGLQSHHALGHSRGDAYRAGFSNHSFQLFREHSGHETPVMNGSSFQPPEFDRYAGEYDSALARGISVSGENKDFFAKGRVEWLARCLAQIDDHPRQVLDYGCGTG